MPHEAVRPLACPSGRQDEERSRFARVVVLALALLGASAALAQPLPPEPPHGPASRGADARERPPKPALWSSFSIFVDQDLFHPSTNEDRDYTMGVGLQASGDFLITTLASNVRWLYLAKPLELVDELTGMARLHQQALEAFTDAGDSGAVWYDPTTMEAVGIHVHGPLQFNADHECAVATPIQNAVRILRVRVVGENA